MVCTALVLCVDMRCVTGHRNSFLPEPARLLYYGPFFALGVEWYARRDRLARLAHRWPACLVASLAAFAAAAPFLGSELQGPLPAATRLLLAASWSLFAWLSVCGFVGLAQRLLARQIPGVRRLADASYWIYLVHFPLVAALQILLAGVPLPAVGKFALVVALTVALCLWSYEHWVRTSVVGVLLNGARAIVPKHGVLVASTS